MSSENNKSDNHRCLQSLIEVFLYIDGQLDPERSNEISDHLQHCQECYGRVEFEKLIKGYVKKRSSKDDEVSDSVIKNVSEMLK